MTKVNESKVVKNEKGLTLIELLAVVVILGILAAIAIPAIGNAIERSRQNADISTLAIIEDAALKYVQLGDGEAVANENIIELVSAGYLAPLKNGGKLQSHSSVGFDTFTVTVSSTTGYTVIIYSNTAKDGTTATTVVDENLIKGITP